MSRSGGTARQTRSVDVFSYGLLLHYCLTGGAHPFGHSYERDANILMVRGVGLPAEQRTLLLVPCSSLSSILLAQPCKVCKGAGG